MKKYYVLDTNILLQSPGAIYGFEDNTVVITGTTLQELDSKKNPDGEIGYNARQTARILEDIRNRGNLIKGVKLKETDGKLIFEPNEVSQENLPEGFDIKKPDNRIISSCIGIARKTKRAVILVTNDIMMRIAAAACGVEVQEYKSLHMWGIVRLKHHGKLLMIYIRSRVLLQRYLLMRSHLWQMNI